MAAGTGHSVDLANWLQRVVSFSSRQRDPQALYQAVLPTVYRQEHPHFMLYSWMPSSSFVSPVTGLGIVSSCLYTNLFDSWLSVVISLFIVQYIYTTSTFKCGLFHDWAWGEFPSMGSCPMVDSNCRPAG